MKKKNLQTFLFVQMFLTILGAFLSFIMFIRMVHSNPTLLSIISNLLYLVAYVIVIVYSTKNYKKEAIYFQYVVYAYAALLGIQILQYGQMLAEMPLKRERRRIDQLLQLDLLRECHQICGLPAE